MIKQQTGATNGGVLTYGEPDVFITVLIILRAFWLVEEMVFN